MANSTVRIGIYQSITDTKGAKEIDLNIFLDHVRSGKWQDLVLPIRAEKDHDKRQLLKKKLPNVTISGTFSERKDSSIKTHSGYVAIDLDDLGSDVEGVRKILSNDSYVYSIFTSSSGLGLCVLFSIDGTKHRQAYEGIKFYLNENYQLICDDKAINESRARYVSFDPDLYHNPKALQFKKYLPKQKEKKIPKTVFVEDDFGIMVRELESKNVCEDYRDWISIGYALAEKFGESGRAYYHALSNPASKYDYKNCDKQYDSILRTSSESKGKKSSLGTIYYFAKLHNIRNYISSSFQSE